MHRNNQRNSIPSPLIISLLTQLYTTINQSDYKPPITIGFIILNIFVHISPNPTILGYDLSNIYQNCIQPHKVISTLINKNEILLNRIVFSSIIHVNDMHLYSNMISFCWKGINLEKKIGSQALMKLIIYSILMSSTLMILLSFILDHFNFSNNISGLHSCAVGFSAVLFSLKYVWNYYSSTNTSSNSNSSTMLLGMNIPMKYLAWVELILISILIPNTSFLGHLAGILAGYIYMKYLKNISFML